MAKTKSATTKKAPAKKTASKKAPVKKAPAKKTASKKAVTITKVKKAPVKLTGFVKKQQVRLLELRDSMLDSMIGVARDNLRSHAEGGEASAFGMHQADAGSDAYDRDFALNLLSQEQDALHEIDEALKRITSGDYGICEVSGKKIPHPRLEAIPFARCTVECQTEIENNARNQHQRGPVTSLFGLSNTATFSQSDD